MPQDDDIDDDELPDESDRDESELDPCPHCGKQIYDDSEWCPHCGTYLAREEELFRLPLWMILGAMLVGLAVLIWVFR